jgi:hypothetical protein
VAEIIPFPVTKRAAFIARAVGTASTYSTAAAANYLRSVIDQHAARLRRIGVEEDLDDRFLESGGA